MSCKMTIYKLKLLSKKGCLQTYTTFIPQEVAGSSFKLLFSINFKMVFQLMFNKNGGVKATHRVTRCDEVLIEDFGEHFLPLAFGFAAKG